MPDGCQCILMKKKSCTGDRKFEEYSDEKSGYLPLPKNPTPPRPSCLVPGLTPSIKLLPSQFYKHSNASANRLTKYCSLQVSNSSKSELRKSLLQCNSHNSSVSPSKCYRHTHTHTHTHISSYSYQLFVNSIK